MSNGRGGLNPRLFASSIVHRAPVPVGYANQGIDVHHYHEHMNDIRLVARGTSTGLIDGQQIELAARDCLVMEPGG